MYRSVLGETGYDRLTF